jgi:hypothetical protein
VGFKVYGYKSEPFDEFGDGDRYKVIEGGVNRPGESGDFLV